MRNNLKRANGKLDDGSEIGAEYGKIYLPDAEHSERKGKTKGAGKNGICFRQTQTE